MTSKKEKLILIINCGSSSLKYEVYDMPLKTSLGKGLIERIGEPVGKIMQDTEKGNFQQDLPIPDHKTAMGLMAKALTDSILGVLKNMSDISGVGHRVVHGGEKYAESVLITNEVIKAVEENCNIAPLHNPPNLVGIREAIALLPHVKHVAVFDTAFHQTLAPSAYLYGLPRELYDKYKIRRYGFHGTSHRYVANRAVKFMKRSIENTNVISCHLGNGASITAIECGRSVDTSMGFTPLEGLMMGTRSGDIDPAITLYLMEHGYKLDEVNKLLNKKSGLLGLSGISNDVRDLEKAADEGNKNALEALEVYAHSVRKYIGAYAANLYKVDILVFTGGIGQNAVKMRERICHRLEHIGIIMDYNKNQEDGTREGIISADYSPTSIVVIPTNEELQIAKDSYKIIYGEDIDIG